MAEKTLKEILSSLPSYIHITGSYARGEETGDSDLDFYVPTHRWESFKKWSEININGNPSSCTMGALTWYEPMMMEFSHLFERQENIPKEVLILNRTFKTW